MNTLPHFALAIICAFCLSTNGCAIKSLNDSMDLKVRDLVIELGRPSATPSDHERFSGKQARIFRELESLGEPAVPYIVRYMDDRRPLPFDYIALTNKAKNSFESMRQYGPSQVVDGLAAILNQITGEHWGFIYNGGTTEARDKSVLQWRAWCVKRFKDKERICLGTD